MLVVLAVPAAAGTDTWMKLIYDDYPQTPLTDPGPGDETAELYTNELHYRIGVQWDVGERGSWTKLRFLYGWLNIDFGAVEKPDNLPRFDKSIYTKLEFTYRARYDNPWAWQARLTPGAGYAQFSDVSDREAQLEGGGWGLYRWSEWDLGLGVVHTLAYGDPMWLPSLIVEYDQGKDWRVQVELPTLADVRYLWRHGIDLGVVGRVDGYRYARDNAKYQDLLDPYGAHSVTTFSGAFGYRFDEQLYFRFEGGYMYDRFLRLEDGTETILNLDMESGFFYRTFLIWGGL
jgi:hypothetical protein